MEANVKRLCAYKSKLILFPRKDGKPKKGEVNDATAEQLKAATQNTTEGVFALPKQSRRCKPETITKEMRSVKVFQKLRQAFIDKRYKGKRDKKASEAKADAPKTADE